MQEILSLDWNEAEKRHIEQLRELISSNPQWFVVGFSKNEEEFEKFEVATYEWMDYAKDNLLWNDKLIGSIIASGNKLLDTKGNIQYINTNSIRLKGTPECNCIQGNTFCVGCSSGNCKSTSWGCGILYLFGCDGHGIC